MKKRLAFLLPVPAIAFVGVAAAQPVPNGAEFQVNTYTTSGQGQPDVAADSNGAFVVTWQSNGSPGTDNSQSSVQGQRYASDGSPAGTQFQVNTTTNYSIYGSSVAMGTNGDFVVTWGNYNYGTFGQRFSSSGATIGNEFTIAGLQAYRPDVGMDSDGDFVVAWDQSSEIMTRRYDSSGAAQGSPFQVNTYATSNQNGQAVALTPGGSFVVTWQSNGSPGSDSDGTSIQARRYDASGVAQGDQFQVNTLTSNAQEDPDVVMLSTGAFLLVWESHAFSPVNVQTIQGRLYASDGTAQGGEFAINAFATANQFEPAVSRDPNDNFVVTWTSTYTTGTDSDQQSTQLRAFDSAATGLFQEFQVNTVITGNQKNGAVAVDGNGDVIVVYDSESSAGTDSDSTSVQAQRLSGPVPVELILFEVE